MLSAKRVERGCGRRPRGQIVFHSNHNGNLDVYAMNADGTDRRHITATTMKTSIRPGHPTVN